MFHGDDLDNISLRLALLDSLQNSPHRAGVRDIRRLLGSQGLWPSCSSSVVVAIARAFLFELVKSIVERGESRGRVGGNVEIVRGRGEAEGARDGLA